MKIGIDLRPIAKTRIGGIPEYLISLLDALFKIDKKNQYLLFYNGLKKLPLDFWWKNQKNIKIFDFKIPNKIFDFLNFFNLIKIENLIGKIDVFLSCHFNLINTNAPQIVVFHDLSFLHFKNFFSLKERFWHFLQKPEISAKKAKKIIAVSFFTKKDLIKFFKIPEEKIEVVYSGINPIFFKKIDENFLKKTKEKYQLPDEFLLYLGAIEKRKNILGLIKSFIIIKKNPQYKNLYLVIVGPKNWHFKEIKKFLEAKKEREFIKFYEPVSNSEKICFYKLAKIFVYPSFFEGFGFPPLEAASLKIPVICSNRSALNEISKDFAILIDPNREEDLSLAIKSLIKEKKLKEFLKKRGEETVLKFSWQNTAEKILKILEDVYLKSQ